MLTSFILLNLLSYLCFPVDMDSKYDKTSKYVKLILRTQPKVDYIEIMTNSDVRNELNWEPHKKVVKIKEFEKGKCIGYRVLIPDSLEKDIYFCFKVVDDKADEGYSRAFYKNSKGEISLVEIDKKTQKYVLNGCNKK